LQIQRISLAQSLWTQEPRRLSRQHRPRSAFRFVRTYARDILDNSNRLSRRFQKTAPPPRAYFPWAHQIFKPTVESASTQSVISRNAASRKTFQTTFHRHVAPSSQKHSHITAAYRKIVSAPHSRATPGECISAHLENSGAIHMMQSAFSTQAEEPLVFLCTKENNSRRNGDVERFFFPSHWNFKENITSFA
jgi:hypothetical protein